MRLLFLTAYNAVVPGTTMLLTVPWINKFSYPSNRKISCKVQKCHAIFFTGTAVLVVIRIVNDVQPYFFWYYGKLHSYVATADFEIPWRVVNDEIGEILQDSKDTLQSLLGKDNSNQQLQHLLDNISKIESINSEKMFLIEKPGVNL